MHQELLITCLKTFPFTPIDCASCLLAFSLTMLFEIVVHDTSERSVGVMSDMIALFITITLAYRLRNLYGMGIFSSNSRAASILLSMATKALCW